MAIRVLSETPTPDGRRILVDYEEDLFLCGKCSKPVRLHKVENRHTPTKAPVLVCEVGGGRTPIPGFALAPLKRQREISLCDGCGQRIEGRDGGLYIRLEHSERQSALVHSRRPECERAARERLSVPSAGGD